MKFSFDWINHSIESFESHWNHWREAWRVPAVHWFMGPVGGSRCEQGARSARAVLFLPEKTARETAARRRRRRKYRCQDESRKKKGGDGKRKKTHAQKRNGKRSGAREAAAGRHTVLICQPSLFAIEKDIAHLDEHVARLVPGQNRAYLNRIVSNRDAFVGRKETGLGSF